MNNRLMLLGLVGGLALGLAASLTGSPVLNAIAAGSEPMMLTAASKLPMWIDSIFRPSISGRS